MGSLLRNIRDVFPLGPAHSEGPPRKILRSMATSRESNRSFVICPDEQILCRMKQVVHDNRMYSDTRLILLVAMPAEFIGAYSDKMSTSTFISIIPRVATREQMRLFARLRSIRTLKELTIDVIHGEGFFDNRIDMMLKLLNDGYTLDVGPESTIGFNQITEIKTAIEWILQQRKVQFRSKYLSSHDLIERARRN
jgi:hypothetical protein